MQYRFEALQGVATGVPGVAGDDEFILHRVLPADEFGDRHLIAAGFELQATQGIGDLAAEFAGVNRVAPEFGERGFGKRSVFVRLCAK